LAGEFKKNSTLTSVFFIFLKIFLNGLGLSPVVMGGTGRREPFSLSPS